MDITSIIKKLDISSIKVFFLRIFGGAESVYEYIIEKALNAVNALGEANADKIQSIRQKMAVINEYAQKYAKYIPAPWVPYADHLNLCFVQIYQATANNNISRDELNGIVSAFKIAYADYMAD